MGSRFMRGIGIVSLLVGLLAWSGAAHAQNANPQGNQGNQGNQFVVLETGDVLDRTTSLRWQKNPAVDIMGSPCDAGEHCPWQDAVNYCVDLGGGYRLPEIKELISLVDYSVPSQKAALEMPNGPFNVVHAFVYWSATENAAGGPGAWLVDFALDNDGAVSAKDKVEVGHTWCVR